jgi:aryl-alcohol dehydrogenase-like predicted oxidoreductase
MQLNKLTLGTVQFGIPYGISNIYGQVSESEIIDILDIAYNYGISILDTASLYGNSEKTLGKFADGRFNIISKIKEVPTNQIWSAEKLSIWMEQEINISLKKLKCDQLYAYLLHRPLDLLKFNDLKYFESLEKLKESGKTSKIGFSVYTPNDLDQLYASYKPDLVQLPMNVLDCEFLKSGWLDKLKEDNVEIHVRSIFLQGLLLMSLEDQILKFPEYSNIWEKWHQQLKDNNLTAIEACWNFVNQYRQIDKVIVGVLSSNELKEILRIPMSKVDFNDICTSDESLIYPSNWRI